MRRSFALLGLLGGCALDTGGAGDDGVYDGSTTGPTTAGGTSESSGPPDPSQGTGPGSGTSSGEAVDGGSSSGPGGGATTGTDGTASGEGSSTGDVPVLACPGGEGLAACYDFADVGSGMLWDGSGNGNDAAASGVGVTLGPFGDAATFDDESEIAVPDSASLDITGSISLEAWVFVDSLPPGNRMGVLDNDGQYAMTIQASDEYRCVLAQQELFVGPVVQHAWTHLACVYDGASIRFYVDGTEIGMVGASGQGDVANTNPMAVGDTSPDFLEPLRGALGGLRVWSRALEPMELCDAAGDACME